MEPGQHNLSMSLPEVLCVLIFRNSDAMGGLNKLPSGY